MNLREILNHKVSEALDSISGLTDCQALINHAKSPQFGHYQANGVMPLAKRLGRKPRELGEEVLQILDLGEIAEKVELAGPGFINIFISPDFLTDTLNKQDKSRLLPTTDSLQTIVIDYSSPNLAKEMHVGHLRSTIIGDAVARVLEYQGHKVVRQNHMGDWGTQFGMLIAELELHLGEGEQAELALNDLEVFYQQSKKHFDEDPQFADTARAYVVKLQSGDQHCRNLWQKFIQVSVAHNLDIYKQLNVGLDNQHIMPESAYNDDLQNVLDDLTAKGLAVESDGAKVVFLEELADKNGDPSVMIVQKSGGGFLYATSDLAAMRYRVNKLQADRILYYIDARQSLHMKQVFTAARKAGYAPESVSLEHHPFGTMMGKDGKPFKTRSGGTVKLADLLVEAVERAEQLLRDKNTDLSDADIKVIARKVGIGAIKYADLSKTRTNDYIFDWDAMMSFEGNTAPYLQYAYTRIRSIFRKADIDPQSFNAEIHIVEPQEKALAMKLLQFEEVVNQVASEGYPHILCNYVYELASAFMSFYEHCPVLKDGVAEETQQSRLQLSKQASETIAKGLDLLGIEVMEKM